LEEYLALAFIAYTYLMFRMDDYNDIN